jgi:hypothetical protein
MWTFSAVAQIEQRFNQWYALVTLMKNGIPESFYLKFANEPSLATAQAEAENLAVQKNLAEAPTAVRLISKYAFRMRFTLDERIALDNAATNANLTAQQKVVVLTLLKDFETKEGEVDLDFPDTLAGVQYFESVQLIATGRANAILGI